MSKKTNRANEVSKKNTTTQTLNNEVVNNAVSEMTAVLNEVKKSFLDTLLDESVAFVGVGNAPDGKSAFVISDNKYFGNMNGLQYLGYLITKIVVSHRDYLPQEIIDEAHRPSEGRTEVVDWRSEVVCSLLESIANGDKENAIPNAFKALDKQMVVGNYKSRDAKTLPKEEILDQDFRLAVEDLCSLNPNGVDDYFGKGFTKAIYELFDKVKKAHKFATDKRWKCFEYYILNKPNGEIAELLAISKQKASQNNRQVLQWFIDEVNNLDAKSLANLGLKR